MFAFEELKEKFLTIPEDIQEAISSNEVNEKLLDLADKYRLQYDEAEELTKEIGYLMLGIKPRKDFIKNVQKASGLDFEKSKELSEEINNTIFADIRESLRKIHEPEEDLDEDLDENLVREELLNELSNPQEKTTDLIKLPKKELIVSQNTVTEKIESKNIPVNSLEKSEKEKSLVVEVVGDKETIEDKPSYASSFAKTTDGKKATKDKQNKPKSYTIDPYREPIE